MNQNDYKIGCNTKTSENLPKTRSPESLESIENLEPLARITVSLPRSLSRQFRLHALDQNTTLSALLARLIRQELDNSK